MQENEYAEGGIVENPVISNARVDEGITCVCELMDSMGLTMLERFQVAKSISAAAHAMLKTGLERVADGLGKYEAMSDELDRIAKAEYVEKTPGQ